MKTNRPMLAAAALMATVIAAAWGLAANENLKTHALPEDGKAPVITLDATGGMIAHTGNEPVMTVRADGTVIVTGAHGGGKRVEGKISPDELQALLRFILDQQRFDQINPDSLKLKGMMAVGDATTVAIMVDADGVKRTLSARALETVIAQQKAMTPLTDAVHFKTVEDRLDHLRYVTLLGGDEGVKKELDLANAELKRAFPAEPALTPDDLFNARAADGNATTTFQKKVRTDDTWHMVSVTVTRQGDKPPTVKAARGADQMLLDSPRQTGRL